MNTPQKPGEFIAYTSSSNSADNLFDFACGVALVGLGLSAAILLIAGAIACAVKLLT